MAIAFTMHITGKNTCIWPYFEGANFGPDFVYTVLTCIVQYDLSNPTGKRWQMLDNHKLVDPSDKVDFRFQQRCYRGCLFNVDRSSCGNTQFFSDFPTLFCAINKNYFYFFVIYYFAGFYALYIFTEVTLRQFSFIFRSWNFFAL